MATSEIEVDRSDVQLKHLNFMRIAVINAAVVVSNLYSYAKENSGALKATVGKVEVAVTAVVGPVYDRLKGLPSYILVVLDNKVDETTHKFDECAPPAVKSAVSKAQSVIKKASELVQDLAEEAKSKGPLGAVSHAGKISKDFSVNQMAVIWYKANQYPALHGVLEMAIPTATYWSEKYNGLVKDLTSKGYRFFSYVPLVPVEEMEKAYKHVEAAVGKEVDAGSPSESGSDKE